MRRHWQKSPGLIRAAIPEFDGIVDRKALFALAARDDVESRLIVRSGTGRRDWSLDHGPFRRSDFRSLPLRNWTLLVQGVDLHLDAGAALLERFAFIPYARLDDLMISYAVPGGGVGPHFDSYDVFLLQGPGRRRWRVSGQSDLRLQPNMPLRILSHFEPTETWDLDPGDMLYLPPSVAHDGVAITECMTYSIGFRAPTARELTDAFLQFLPDRIAIDDSRYADPDLKATANPARIGSAMRQRLAAPLRAIRWTPPLVDEFIGCTLSEPKPGVFLERPQPPLAAAAFARAVLRSGAVRLDRRSRMLYDRTHIYLNGEAFAPLAGHRALAELADARALAVDASVTIPTLERLHAAYLNGALHVGRSEA